MIKKSEREVTKRCSSCSKYKSLSKFHRDKTHKDGRSSRCASCRTRLNNEWLSRHPEKRKRYSKNYYSKHRDKLIRKYAQLPTRQKLAKKIKEKYNLSLEEYDQLYEHSSGRCYICGCNTDSLNVDHNHSSGLVRGLLCHRCNIFLGFIEKDHHLYILTMEYLHCYDREQYARLVQEANT